jgi:hypothetical protein
MNNGKSRIFLVIFVPSLSAKWRIVVKKVILYIGQGPLKSKVLAHFIIRYSLFIIHYSIVAIHYSIKKASPPEDLF